MTPLILGGLTLSHPRRSGPDTPDSEAETCGNHHRVAVQVLQPSANHEDMTIVHVEILARRRELRRNMASSPSVVNDSSKERIQHFSPSGPFDDLGIPDDDKSVGGAGEPDVEAFAAAIAAPVLVEAEHDGAAFQALEAEDVAVEHVVVGPELLPVGR